MLGKAFKPYKYFYKFTLRIYGSNFGNKSNFCMLFEVLTLTFYRQVYYTRSVRRLHRRPQSHFAPASLFHYSVRSVLPFGAAGKLKM
jgi:hypothetical protein